MWSGFSSYYGDPIKWTGSYPFPITGILYVNQLSTALFANSPLG